LFLFFISSPLVRYNLTAKQKLAYNNNNERSAEVCRATLNRPKTFRTKKEKNEHDYKHLFWQQTNFFTTAFNKCAGFKDKQQIH